jgi:ABC-type phosphate transport system ATPase subunit
MDLKVHIENIKNINHCEFVLPIEKGIYGLVGANGCGKSTVLSCIAQCVFSSSLQNLSEFDYGENSFVEFSYGGQHTIWKSSDNSWKTDCNRNQRIHFNGMYEGSLFYGTRFDDSLKVDDLVKNSTISSDDIVDADLYIKQQMSFILHGDLNHYGTLKRIRNKRIAQKVNLKNTPYFQEIKGNLISQYKMSSGECLLVSLLHFIYNALIRRSLPVDEPILMLIDEIELALHPVAVSRLIDLLNNIIKEHDNLTVVLTSHSPEVIRKISPNNLFMMEIDEKNTIEFYSPCYPSYAIRDVYMHSGFDCVILVEDLLAKYVVEKVIQQKSLNSGKLINVLPVGGWENVLKFQMMAYATNTFGIGTKLFSILDGDIQNNGKIKKEYCKLQPMFLPINSIEKYLYNVCTDSSYKSIKRKINDTFFNVESIDDILADYVQDNDNNGKSLYRKILINLEKRNISEDSFIKELCSIIMNANNFEAFASELQSRIS